MWFWEGRQQAATEASRFVSQYPLQILPAAQGRQPGQNSPHICSTCNTEPSCSHALIQRLLFSFRIVSTLTLFLSPANHTFHFWRGSLVRGCADLLYSPMGIRQTTARSWLMVHWTALVLRMLRAGWARGPLFLYEWIFTHGVHSELTDLT